MRFNKEFYNQIKGTTMDKTLTLTYGTFLIGYFETTLYIVCISKYEELLAE